MKIYWAGWCKNSTSDKIWGILTVNNNLDIDNVYYTFWCRRGGKMRFKRTDDLRYTHKCNNGYKEINAIKLEEIYPGFFDEAESNLVFDLMAGKVR